MKYQELNQRRFTDKAVKIIRHAAARAGDRGLYHVNQQAYVTLILWSLIRWERTVGFVSLERLGVDLDQLGRQLDTILTQRANDDPVVYSRSRNCLIFKKTGEQYHEWDEAVVAEPLICQAERESRSLKHDYVGTEHLLLAIIRNADFELRQILDSHLANDENVRAMIREILHS